MNKTHLEPYGSLFHPDWRESGVQLTGKQAVLLMHDTHPRALKASVLYYNKRHRYNRALNNGIA